MTENRSEEILAYYITSHGFGHAVRSFEIIRSLRRKAPGVRIVLVSDLPEFLLEQVRDPGVFFRRKKADLGLVQLDSLRFDLEATFLSVREMYQNRGVLVDEELEFLEKTGVRLLVSDVGFLPLVAAARAGIPAVAVGNFTWHWIYESYAREDPRWAPLVEWVGGCYRRCSLFLRLPMHGEDPEWSEGVEDVPLVARRARLSPNEVRKILGCPPDRKLYLIAFGALDLSPEAQRRLEERKEALFLYRHPLRFDFANGRSVDSCEQLSYADLVGAVDAVVTKPGYGIVSDCLAHGTPMIYTDRGFFIEYEVLVREIRRHLTWAYLSSDDLVAGNWSPALEAIRKSPRKVPSIRDDGADVCARRILSLLNEETAVFPIEEVLDLHAFDPKEVPDLLDDYLRAAFQAGMTRVRIIHGKGSGVLARRVQSLLSRHPLVTSSRSATPDSGGWGATVAFLKET